jgi:hypothetical protein
VEQRLATGGLVVVVILAELALLMVGLGLLTQALVVVVVDLLGVMAGLVVRALLS